MLVEVPISAGGHPANVQPDCESRYGDRSPGGRDDVSNVAAGALGLVLTGASDAVYVGTFELGHGGLMVDFGEGRVCGTCFPCRHATGQPCAVTGNDP